MGSYRPRWTARWANLSSTETNGHNKSAKWANGRSKAEMAKQQRAAAAAKTPTRSLSLSFVRMLWVTVWAALLVLSCWPSLFRSRSRFTYAYVTHRFTRPVAQWFFFFIWWWFIVENFPVFVGNHVRYFPPISLPCPFCLHYLISYAVTISERVVLQTQLFTRFLSPHGISTSGILRFFFMITTHWKIQPCYSFSRLVSWSVTVGQLLPTLPTDDLQ